MSTRNVGTSTRIYFGINATDLPANTAKQVVCPAAGYIVGWGIIVQGAVTTGGTIKLKNVTTDVVGSSLTVANSAAVGTQVNNTPTVDDATCKVTAGQRLQVVPASFATAGAVEGYIDIGSDPHSTF